MSFVSEHPIKSVRKARRCCACGQMVNAGEAAISWAGVSDGEFSAVIYHPDCRAAEIALNKLNDTLFPDEWMSFADMDREDRPWLLSEHPTVAARLNITDASIQADREDAEACRAAWVSWSRPASADTRPQDEDPLGASLASGAVPEGQAPKGEHP